jgi:hypothetical protein
MGTKMVKAGVAVAAAALAAGAAGMFGGTAVAGGHDGHEGVNNGPRCGITAFIPVSAILGVNTGDQYACNSF